MTSRSLSWLAAVQVLFLAGNAIHAEQPVSYARQVKPFLAKYCLECHNSNTTKGDLDLETFKGMMQGGGNGPVVVPGKADESRLVLQPEHKTKPFMPPKSAKQPSAEEVAVLRAWVVGGAKDDSVTVNVAIPDIKPRVQRPAPITALAFDPLGGLLAVGRHKEIVLVDPLGGEVMPSILALQAKVTALAFYECSDGGRLAVACSEPGRRGYVAIYGFSPCCNAILERTLVGHKDAILAIALTADGKILASTGYDRTIKLWDTTTGKELHTLKDHSDAVYSLAFSPNGKLLASASADRAVKVWDVATGKRLYTLGESTDWVYAVAWSPDGEHLAAGGVDKSIRVWQVSAAAGKIVQSVFGHEAAITRLLYSADGKTLYSLGEDRVLKAWNSARMVERKVYDRQPEAALTLALRPDGKQIAIGRYDGALVLLDQASGKVQSEPLPEKPRTPQLLKLSPGAGPRGRTLRITFEGKNLASAKEVTATYPGVAAKFLQEGRSSDRISADVVFPSHTPAGVYKLGLSTSSGQTAQLPFTVDLFPEIAETGLHDAPRLGQPLTLPATVVGDIGRPGQVDFYRFDAKAAQQVGVQAMTAAVGSKLEPVLQLLNDNDQVVAESGTGALGYTCEKPGSYALSIRDRAYRGGGQKHYRLHIGDVPVVTSVFPLGIQRGTEMTVHILGVNLGGVSSLQLKAPQDAIVGSRLSVPIASSPEAPLGMPSLVVGDFPELVAAHGSESGHAVPVPGTANGIIVQGGSADTWRFPARKAQRLILEVNARRLGSPLDSYIEILNMHGRPVPQATLRCVAKTDVVFRDHDSAGSGIRIETWNQLAMNDYLWVGNQLLRIRDLPKNPDDDCQFWSLGAQRLGYLGTTPTYIYMGAPMYKVAIHPPGTKFPPNGFPVIDLPYRNDDGGPGFGKDSRLFFDPPADGMYQVRIGDARGQGGPDYAYRLTIRPPRPSFNISFSPIAPAVWRGGAVPITVSADRIDGFDGPIDVHLENIPPGFSAPATTIPAEETSTAFAFASDPAVKTPTKMPPLKLVARARIDGQEVLREMAGGLPRVMEPGNLTTTTEQSEITVKPGQQVWLTARIERRNKFHGRVPLEVRGLPHGVRVLDIGLNGILITEKETSRTFAIYAEPWVQPMTHPFVVLAKQESTGKEFAAKSVLLRIEGPGQ